MKVRKAVIPAAGLGTRFLPATKAMPKEMLPIVDKPTIQFVIEEAVNSGIEDIIIISGRHKRAIEDHFDRSVELEIALRDKENYELLKQIDDISSMVNIHYVRQKTPLGLGHAIWCARKFIGNEPFAVLLGDDIIQSETPVLKQMIDQFDKVKNSIIAIQEVAQEETNLYGIIDPLEKTDDLYKINNLIEKPKTNAPSNLAIIGRYILTPEIFELLENEQPDASKEIQLTNALQKLNKTQYIFGYKFSGTRYDVGNKLGYIKATIDFALKHPELKEEVVSYLKNLNI